MNRSKLLFLIGLLAGLAIVFAAAHIPNAARATRNFEGFDNPFDIYLPLITNRAMNSDPFTGPLGYGILSLPEPAPVTFAPSLEAALLLPASPIVSTNVRAAGGPNTGTQAELAMASAGSNIVIVFNGGTNGSGFVTSRDGGVTWSAIASPPLPAGSRPCCDPGVVSDLAGRFYFMQLFRDDGANNPNAGNCTNSLHVSTDGGQTFSNIVGSPFSFAPGTTDFPDMPHIGIDRLNLVNGQPQLYTFTRHFVNGINCPQTGGSGSMQGEVSCSTNGGVNWTAPIVLAPSTDLAHWATGSDGSVYLVGNGSGNNNTTRLLLRRSTNSCNAGLNFGAPVTVADNLTFGPTGIDREFAQAYVAVDKNDPNVAYVVWSSDRLTNVADRDIFLARCTFTGTTGTCQAPVRVNDNPVGDNTAQYFPMMCVAPDNTINISWNDQRAGANSTAIFHAEVSATGASLGVGTNFITSDVNFTPFNFGGTPDYGDYNENYDACDATHFYAAWTSHVSPPGITPASNDPDVFFAAINNLSDIRVRTSLGFEVCSGASQERKLEIFNVGDAFLRVTSVSRISGSADITVDADPVVPMLINPGAQVNFTVRCSPSSLGPKTAVIRIASDDRDRPVIDLTATCNVDEPDINLSMADSGDFGDVCLADYADQTLQILNQGRCDLNISQITSSDPANMVLPSSLQFPLVLQPHASVNVPVRFKPDTTLACSNTTVRTAQINIQSNDPDEALVSQTVSGRVPCPTATTSGELDFSGKCVGDTQTETVQVCNTGKCNLKVTGAALVGPDCDDLTLVSPNPAPTPAKPLNLSHDLCYGFVVRFKPDDPTPPSCSLEVTTADPDNPTLTFPIGAAIDSAQLVLDPPNLSGIYAFPPTVSDPTGVLGCSSERTLTLRNIGSCPAQITDINTGLSSPFAVTAPTVFPITLPPGNDPLGITVRFKPTTQGGSVTAPDETTGTLNILSNTPQGPLSGQLCGEAVVQSGGRWLIVDSAGQPIGSVDRISLQSFGIHQPSPVDIRLTDVSPTSVQICGNTVTYHLDQEDLPPAGTTGANPNSSYKIEAKDGNFSVTQSFVLDQCEFKQEVFKLP